MKTDKSMNARGVFSAKLNIHDQTFFPVSAKSLYERFLNTPLIT